LNFLSSSIPVEVRQIISQVPNWADAGDIQVEALEGLTNTNYSVRVDGEHYVLRVSGRNTSRLGIDRKLEVDALLAASRSGIGPQLVYSILPEGHLVTRFIEGHHFTLKEYRTKENLQRIVATVKRLHTLAPVEALFSPFQRVEAYTREARAMQVPFPADFERLLERMTAIRNDQAEDASDWLHFCHNDLFCVNVMDDGQVRLIDWELAGMGDIYYDLATLFYAYDSPDTLPRELQEYVLGCYFGEVSAKNRKRLAGMQYMLMFYSAMWGMLQFGMQREGLVRLVDGFDFMEYAETTFDAMRIFPGWVGS
jgi:thiamine kinase-like enzyme